MKLIVKFLLCVLLTAALLAPFGITLSANELSILLNGQEIDMMDKPIISESRTMVPLRGICETLGIDLYWDAGTETAFMRKGDTFISHKALTNVAYINYEPITFDTNSKIINDRLYIPLIMVSDALGAELRYDSETRSVLMEWDFSGLGLVLGAKNVSIGDTLESVKKTFGEPGRISPSAYGFDWYAYNADYKSFILIGIQNGFVKAFYTNSPGFQYDGVKFGAKLPEGGSGAREVKFFTMSDSSVYAVFVNINSYSQTAFGANPAKIAESEALNLFDMTNALRVQNGLPACENARGLSEAAAGHAADLAVNNYWSHESLDGSKTIDRVKRSNVFFVSCAENLAAGNATAPATFHQLVTSEPHRVNMMNSGYSVMGVGMGYSAASDYRYYYCQLFVGNEY